MVTLSISMVLPACSVPIDGVVTVLLNDLVEEVELAEINVYVSLAIWAMSPIESDCMFTRTISFSSKTFNPSLFLSYRFTFIPDLAFLSC